VWLTPLRGLDFGERQFESSHPPWQWWGCFVSVIRAVDFHYRCGRRIWWEAQAMHSWWVWVLARAELGTAVFHCVPLWASGGPVFNLTSSPRKSTMFTNI